ncbi:hypothetical protein [Spongiactinospora sp. TRM90649]|uniref:hypothetical protein n=1 Tax=Spongiactinospora sp. TRM90649 TaxID=3031114 RepID=UPI0023F621EB|nr:hypothetical protein [Spongiactinospora sp. TRM90649]MDF5754126.1 hypothetical protein [Spongiactinospora sp. TRM90649]
MAIRIDDLRGDAELPDDALDAVVGGRPPMTPPSPRVCTSINNGQPDTCWDFS